MNAATIDLLQRRIASTSVGPSTARNMGPKGTIQAARDKIASLKLGRFSVDDQVAFGRRLDGATRSLMWALPYEAQYWGPARKFVNIFLRGVVYNRHLCRHYELARIEKWLEVPLDSHVARGLRDEIGGDRLPRWHSVKHLTRAASKAHQDFAALVASEKEISRVHLDLYYWRRS